MYRILALSLFLPALAACSGLGIFDGAASGPTAAALSEPEIAAGLREALATGADRAVARIGRTDGFWNDAQLRIPLPDSLKKTEKMLRRLGQDRVVDEFHLSLNRAAERAVPEAAGIFSKAIRELTLADAGRILAGAPDAATAYLRGKTAGSLTASFRPIVSRATDASGVTRRYKDLAAKAGRFVGMDAQSTDLDAYVTERALDGLFRTLADEERKIRDNPTARTSELLQRVFGGRARQ
jgi:hypothetical protein